MISGNLTAVMNTLGPRGGRKISDLILSVFRETPRWLYKKKGVPGKERSEVL